jgi:hypothetical protein
MRAGSLCEQWLLVTTFLGTVRLSMQVRGPVKRLDRVLEKIEERSADAVMQATDEMKEKVENYMQVLETDRFEGSGTAAVDT